MNNPNLQTAIMAALKAGRAIMDIYKEEDFQIVQKKDESPLTIADERANDIINKYLVTTGIPIISEENKQISYEKRKNWTKCWIVDPLDGTKEFIKRNGEFTVNIALIEEGKPKLGVIYAPALQMLYFADVKDGKAYRVVVNTTTEQYEKFKDETEEIRPKAGGTYIKVVGSRSHMNQDTLDFIEDLKKKGKEVEVVSKGSSLKFCLVAEGAAQIYPRFAPTMEWDTAAGQAICEAVGLKCLLKNSGESMTYNRKNLLNDHFFVSYEG